MSNSGGRRYLSDRIYGEVESRMRFIRFRSGELERVTPRWTALFYVPAPFGGGKTQAAAGIGVYTVAGYHTFLSDICRVTIMTEPTRSTLIAAARRILIELYEVAREEAARAPITKYLPIPPEKVRRLGRALILAGTDVSCLNEEVMNAVRQCADIIAVRAASRLWSCIMNLIYTGIPEKLGLERSEEFLRVAAELLGVSAESLEDLYQVVRQGIEQALSQIGDIQGALQQMLSGYVDYAREVVARALATFTRLVRERRRNPVEIDEESLQRLAECIIESMFEAEVEASLAPFCQACKYNDRAACFRLLEHIFMHSPYLAITSARDPLGAPEERELIEAGVYVTGRRIFEEVKQEGFEACPYRALLRLLIYEPRIWRGEAVGLHIPRDLLKYVFVCTHQIFFGAVRRLLEQYYSEARKHGTAIPHLLIIDEADVPALSPPETVEIPSLLTFLSPDEVVNKVRELYKTVGVDEKKTGPALLLRVVERIAEQAQRIEQALRAVREEFRIYGFAPARDIADIVREVLLNLRNVHNEWLTSARSGLRTLQESAAQVLSTSPDLAPFIYTWTSVCRRCLALVEALKDIPETVFDSPQFTYWIEMPRVHLLDFEALSIRHEDRLHLMLATLPLLVLKRYDVAAKILLDHTYPYPARVRIYMSATLSKSMLLDLFRATLPQDYLDEIMNPARRPRNLARQLDVEWIEFENPYQNVYIWVALSWLDTSTYKLFHETGRGFMRQGFADAASITTLYNAIVRMAALYGMRKSDFLAAIEIAGPGLTISQAILLNMLHELYTVARQIIERGLMDRIDHVFSFVIFGTSPQFEVVCRYGELLVEQGSFTISQGVYPSMVTIYRVEPFEGRRDLYYVEAEVEGVKILVLMTYAKSREGRGVDIDVVAARLIGDLDRTLITSYVMSQPLREPTSLYAAEVQRSRSFLAVENTEAVNQQFQAAFRIVRALAYDKPRVVMIDVMAWPGQQQLDILPTYLRDMLRDAVNNNNFTYAAYAWYQLLLAYGGVFPI